MADLRVGDIVEVQGQRATIRYIGETAFADGEWVGVELDHPTGKNNGTVQDTQYFVCREKYGMFVRINVPRLMERPAKPQQKQPLQKPKPSPVSVSLSGFAVCAWDDRRLDRDVELHVGIGS